MADVRMQVLWQFSADPDEAALILAALGGRLKEEDKPLAKTLGDRLTLMRAKVAKGYVDSMEKHASKVLIGD